MNGIEFKTEEEQHKESVYVFNLSLEVFIAVHVLGLYFKMP